eukprot:SAG22_NODE_7404_length_743_cov_0.715839_1_plen_68_part_10
MSWTTQEVLFCANLLSWAYFRLYLLPVAVMARGTVPFLGWLAGVADSQQDGPIDMQQHQQAEQQVSGQ